MTGNVDIASNTLVFAGGVPRSGLTLLRAIMDAHPDIFCGPDSGVVPGLAMQWGNFSTELGDLHQQDFDLAPSAVRDNFAETIARILTKPLSMGKARLVIEKNPLNILAFKELAELFPSAKFIHVARDGRDVVASLLERSWRDPATGAPYAHVNDAGAAAEYWSGLCQIGLQAEAALNDESRFFTLPYELLVEEPALTLETLCDFLNVPFTPDILKFYERPIRLVGIEQDSRERLRQPITPDRIGRWRSALTQAQQHSVEEKAAGALSLLGY